MRPLLAVYLKGFAMGAADVVPGVSGGTIALIVGIYDRLIRAITAIDPREFEPALGLRDPEARRALLEALERMDAFFLLALGAGVATAVVGLSRVAHGAATAYPVPTYAFFFGLIAASAVVLYGEVDAWTPGRAGVAVAGIGVAALVSGASSTGASHGYAMVFVAGAVAICAMVLPGVSGAFFLLLLGQYEYLTGALSALVDGLLALVAGDSVAPVLEAGSVVAVFGAGAVLGLFTMAHGIRRALDRYRAATITFLVSLMVGGLRLPAEEVLAALDGSTTDVGGALVAGAVGCAAVLVVDYYTDDIEYASDDAEAAAVR